MLSPDCFSSATAQDSAGAIKFLGAYCSTVRKTTTQHPSELVQVNAGSHACTMDLTISKGGGQAQQGVTKKRSCILFLSDVHGKR
jgi:polysaccharide pyruvyl transferase WcaK-like protein